MAISDLSKVLEINPRDAKLYFIRGRVYSEKGEYELALADFDHAVEINPGFAVAYYNRGSVYFLREEYDKAWNDIKEAQELGYEVPLEFLKVLRKVSGREI